MNKEVEGRSLREDLMMEKAVYCGMFNAFLWAAVCLGEPSAGAILEYSTLLGPRADSVPYAKYVGIGVDAAGCAYVSTSIPQTGFPTTPDAYQTTHSQTALDRNLNGHYDMFLSVIDASGGKLLYSTVLGGTDYDTGQALVLDQHNGVYIAGTTRSADFPTASGAFQRAYSGLGEGPCGGDVFVVKLNLGILKTENGGADSQTGS